MPVLAEMAPREVAADPVEGVDDDGVAGPGVGQELVEAVAVDVVPLPWKWNNSGQVVEAEFGGGREVFRRDLEIEEAVAVLLEAGSGAAADGEQGQQPPGGGPVDPGLRDHTFEHGEQFLPLVRDGTFTFVGGQVWGGAECGAPEPYPGVDAAAGEVDASGRKRGVGIAVQGGRRLARRDRLDLFAQGTGDRDVPFGE
jgi:hypothetical protein